MWRQKLTIHYGYINKDELIIGVRVLESLGYVKDNDSEKQPKESMNVHVTEAGREYLRNRGMI